jgi:hypothetical protein
MLSLERVRELMGKDGEDAPEDEIRQIRDEFYLLSDIIYEHMQAKRELENNEKKEEE